jgi:hypothetical protein
MDTNSGYQKNKFKEWRQHTFLSVVTGTEYNIKVMEILQYWEKQIMTVSSFIMFPN